MIAPGSFVFLNPPDITRIFCEHQAILFAEKLPLIGIMSRIDGEVGRMSYLRPNGKKGEIAVLLSELIPVGVPHAD